MLRVSVIVINYDGRDFMIDCLIALEGQTFKDFDIVIVDNCSSDNSLLKIRKFLEKNPLTNTTTLNSFKKNHKAHITGLELSREASFNFAEIQKHLKILGFHF